MADDIEHDSQFEKDMQDRMLRLSSKATEQIRNTSDSHKTSQIQPNNFGIQKCLTVSMKSVTRRVMKINGYSITFILTEFLPTRYWKRTS